MKSAKWLASICRKVVGLIGVLCVLMAIFVFACYLVRQYERIKTSEGFKRNENLYENMVSSSVGIGDFSNREKHYTVSEKMIEVGVGDIYSWRKNVFFEHQQKVLFMFPQGIVYVQQRDSLPTWMKLTWISGQWYYYRVVS